MVPTFCYESHGVNVSFRARRHKRPLESSGNDSVDIFDDSPKNPKKANLVVDVSDADSSSESEE